jgi:Rhs element Vgr protein
VSDGFIIPTILIDGQALESSFALLGIDVTLAVNRIPAAMVLVQAPGILLSETPLMAGGPFAPAAEVEIKLGGADGNDVSVFKGVVTGLAVHTRDGVPTLEAVIKDKAICLVGARHSKVWIDMADSDAIRDIVEAATLTLGDAPDTQPVHKTLVQYECTDWDFILSRADALSLVVVVQDGTLSLKKMEVSGPAARTFSFGLDAITDIHFELDAATQTSSLSAVVWDPDQLAAADPADAEVLSLPQGNIAGKAVGEALGIGPAHVTHMVPLPAAEARAWATSRMARARLALIRGRMTVPGLPDVQPMEVEKLEGFGDQFNGNALITGVRHRLDSRGYSTDLQFGLSPDPVGRLPDLAAMPAGGLLPPMCDLQVGIVQDTEDPDEQGRVQVTVPAILTDGSLWARVASPDAGNKRGFCFMPEEGDEVLVGFLAGDPRYPVVLGRLHGSKNVLPDGFKDIKKKGIVTKQGARLEFSEADKPSVTISTPGGRTVVLDDDGETITIKDKNNNTITLDTNGITIESGKDLTLKASGTVKVTGSTIDLN